MLATTSTTNMRCVALRHNFSSLQPYFLQPGSVNNYKQNVRTKKLSQKSFFMNHCHHPSVKFNKIKNVKNAGGGGEVEKEVKILML